MIKKKAGKLDQILDNQKVFDEKLDKHAKEFIKFDQKFDKINDKIDNKFNDVLNGLDKITGELENVREDQILAKSEDKKQNDRLTGLELKVG